MASPSSAESIFVPTESKDDYENTNKKTTTNGSYNYKDEISALPKVKSWFNRDLRLYQGCYYVPFCLPGLMRMQQHFMARSSDVILASFPKSGTTWLKALVLAICSRTRYKKEDHPLLTKLSHHCIPSMELIIYKGGHASNLLDNNQLEQRIFSTHARYTSLPRSVVNCTCKIVYISRDPKDVFISLWHFAPKVIDQFFPDDKVEVAMSDEEFIKAYDLFCQGICPNGPYWGHVLSYWKASVENPNKLLFLKYEDVKREPQLYVKNLAEFLGVPFSLKEEEEGEVQFIVDLCSFEFMSGLNVNKTGISPMNFTNDAYYRKGEVGDWKNHLTLDMANRLDEITRQKFDGYGLSLW